MIKNKRIEGIFLFLFTITDDRVVKLLVLRELVGKIAFAKKAGMLSAPAETCKPADVNLEGTIQRMLIEEVDADGRANKLTEIIGISKEPCQANPFRDDVDVHYAWGFYHGSVADITFWKPQDNDIELVGWLTIKEFFANELRVEITPLFQRMADNIEFMSWLHALDQKRFNTGDQ